MKSAHKVQQLCKYIYIFKKSTIRVKTEVKLKSVVVRGFSSSVLESVSATRWQATWQNEGSLLEHPNIQQNKVETNSHWLDFSFGVNEMSPQRDALRDGGRGRGGAKGREEALA